MMLSNCPIQNNRRHEKDFFRAVFVNLFVDVFDLSFAHEFKRFNSFRDIAFFHKDKTAQYPIQRIFLNVFFIGKRFSHNAHIVYYFWTKNNNWHFFRDTHFYLVAKGLYFYRPIFPLLMIYQIAIFFQKMPGDGTTDSGERPSGVRMQFFFRWVGGRLSTLILWLFVLADWKKSRVATKIRTVRWSQPKA